MKYKTPFHAPCGDYFSLITMCGRDLNLYPTEGILGLETFVTTRGYDGWVKCEQCLQAIDPLVRLSYTKL